MPRSLALNAFRVVLRTLVVINLVFGAAVTIAFVFSLLAPAEGDETDEDQLMLQ